MRHPEPAARFLAAILAAVALAAAGRGAAQPPPGTEPETPPVPRYRVEFILFAHNDVDPGEEVFAPELETALRAQPVPVLRSEPFAPRRSAQRDGGGALAEPGVEPRVDPGASPPAGSDALELIDPFGRPEDAPAARAPFQFRILGNDELELANEYARIDRLGAYRVIAHGGWVQEGLDGSAAQPMNLANLGIVNPSGTLRLRLSRYLHLDVDLRYHARQPGAGIAAAADGGDARAFGEPPLAEEPPPGEPAFEDGAFGDRALGDGAFENRAFGQPALGELSLGPSYRMAEARRVVRSGELHYVDHPMFGLLFKISPAPVEETDDDDANVTPAA